MASKKLLLKQKEVAGSFRFWERCIRQFSDQLQWHFCHGLHFHSIDIAKKSSSELQVGLER